MTKAKVPR